MPRSWRGRSSASASWCVIAAIVTLRWRRVGRRRGWAIADNRIACASRFRHPDCDSPDHDVPLLTVTGAQDAIAPGVPLTLAEERAARVRDVRYELRFSIPEAMTTAVTGSVTVHFTLTDASRPLVLDFAGNPDRVRDLRSGATPVAIDVRNEHVIVPASALRKGANAITLRFDASDLALNRNPEFMYTLFVPARARLAFPCFDQPDIKARYALTLDVPAGWEAVSNAVETRRTRRAPGRRSDSTRRSRSRRICSRLRRGAFRWRPPSAVAGDSGCSTARPMRRRWRGTATRSSTCTRQRWRGSSATPTCLSVRQVRLRAGPRVPVRRHGACGEHAARPGFWVSAKSPAAAAADSDAS